MRQALSLCDNFVMQETLRKRLLSGLLSGDASTLKELAAELAEQGGGPIVTSSVFTSANPALVAMAFGQPSHRLARFGPSYELGAIIAGAVADYCHTFLARNERGASKLLLQNYAWRSWSDLRPTHRHPSPTTRPIGGLHGCIKGAHGPVREIWGRVVAAALSRVGSEGSCLGSAPVTRRGGLAQTPARAVHGDMTRRLTGLTFSWVRWASCS